MKTTIYYFTGTGNSLAAARKIASILRECELVPVASLQNFRDDIHPSAGRIGIICRKFWMQLICQEILRNWFWKIIERKIKDSCLLIRHPISDIILDDNRRSLMRDKWERDRFTHPSL
jgi:hypothetical protein